MNPFEDLSGLTRSTGATRCTAGGTSHPLREARSAKARNETNFCRPADAGRRVPTRSQSVPYPRGEGVHDPARVAGGAVGSAVGVPSEVPRDPEVDPRRSARRRSSVESARWRRPPAIPERDRLEQRVPRPRDGVFGAYGATTSLPAPRCGVAAPPASDRSPRERRDDLAEVRRSSRRVGQLCRDARASVGDDEELGGRRGGRVGSEIPRVDHTSSSSSSSSREPPARIEVLSFGPVGRRDLRGRRRRLAWWWTRASRTPRALKGPGLGDVSRGLVPFASAASSSSASTARLANRATPAPSRRWAYRRRDVVGRSHRAFRRLPPPSDGPSRTPSSSTRRTAAPYRGSFSTSLRRVSTRASSPPASASNTLLADRRKV